MSFGDCRVMCSQCVPSTLEGLGLFLCREASPLGLQFPSRGCHDQDGYCDPPQLTVGARSERRAVHRKCDDEPTLRVGAFSRFPSLRCGGA